MSTPDMPHGACECGAPMADAGSPIGLYCTRGWKCPRLPGGPMSAPHDPWKDILAGWCGNPWEPTRFGVAGSYGWCAHCGASQQVHDIGTIHAADAATIATLRATVAADDERLRTAGARVGVEYGCDTADWMAERILELRATVDQQQARITALEAALKPFAALADCYDPPEGDDHQPTWDRKPTLGQVRQARQALETP